MKLSNHSSHNPNQKSRLFFLEFLIVLFFFLIISTVCIRLFAQAKAISDRAEALSQAHTAAASAAEILIAEYENPESLLPSASKSVEDRSLDITSLLTQYENTSSSCIMNIISNQNDTVTQYLIQMYAANSPDDSEPLYEISLDLHVPLTRGEVLP